MVEYWEPPVCEICGSEDARMCPLMTGVGFEEPPENQVYVCGDCIWCWRDGGGTTIEELKKSRGLCDICSAPNVEKKYTRFGFEYRTPSGDIKMLFAEANIYQCNACGLGYTDSEAEDARDKAVSEYLNGAKAAKKE